MPSPSPSWGTKRVYITYRNVLSGAMESGSWTAKSDVRITNTLSDGKHQVFLKGSLGSGTLNTTEGVPSLSVELPIVDDPDNMPSGGVITLQITIGGGSEIFKLSPLLSWPDAGTDLALILDPTVVASAPPFSIKGVAGGVAALNSSGQVVDAAGNVVGSGGSGGTSTWTSLSGKPTVVASGSTAAEARSVIAVPSTTEMNTALLLKANSANPAFTGTPTGLVKTHVGLGNVDNTSDLNKPISTAASDALSSKADLSSGKVPVSQLPNAETFPNFTEAVQDVTGALIKAGSNVTVSYDDAAGTLTINSTGGTGGSTDVEIVRDTIAAAMVAGTGTQITVNDAADTITIAVSGLTTGMITGLDTALSARVDLTTAQTIAGVKTFSSIPVVPDNSFALAKTIGLVTALAGKVATTGNETIAGVKTFSSAPLVPDDSWTISDVAGLITALAAKLDKNSVNIPKMYVWNGTVWPTVDVNDVAVRWFYSGGYPAAPNPAASIPNASSVLKLNDFWDYDEASTVA